jgi:hypothetical protein
LLFDRGIESTRLACAEIDFPRTVLLRLKIQNNLSINDNFEIWEQTMRELVEKKSVLTPFPRQIPQLVALRADPASQLTHDADAPS